MSTLADYRRSYSPPDWQAREAAAADSNSDPEEEARWRRSRRRAFSCWDRLCGADDCETCHPRHSRPRPR